MSNSAVRNDITTIENDLQTAAVSNTVSASSLAVPVTVSIPKLSSPISATKSQSFSPSASATSSLIPAGTKSMIAFNTKENINKESDMITLHMLTMEKEKSTSVLPQTGATSTPLTTKKNYFTKRPLNLNLKIHAPTHTTTAAILSNSSSSSSSSSTASKTNDQLKTQREKYAETENAILSNTKSLATSTTTTISMTSDMIPTGANVAITIPNTTNASLQSPTAASPSTTSSTVVASTRTKSTSATSPTETIFPHEQYKTLKKLDIGFDNICYSAKVGFFKRQTKHIINGVTGNFRSGELSAIVGPSGAGKSTFLNILSAYTPYGYSGDITVNGHLRDIKAFKPNVAFITQDTSLQPYLTVKEAMHFSANLKIGAHMTASAKKERVRKILEAIGMYENRHTRTGKLSGGQKKRLAIALELVNNPPVLILDEPTSGLDSSTSNQCISLLKKLAMEGRTVICTIHQPSALTFEMFDHLYAIAEGYCIYSGGTRNLVPFLAEIGLNCPESYNPADYLMEIATDDYGKQNPFLVEKIQNGRNESYRQGKGAQKSQLEAMKKIDKMMASGLITPVTAPILTAPLGITECPSIETQHQVQLASNNKNNKQLTPISEMSSKVWNSSGLANENNPPTTKNKSNSKDVCKPKKPSPVPLDPAKLCSRENIYATPFYRQLSILLLRTFLILWRDKSLTTMRFVIHFLTAFLIGFLYYGIGNDAGNAINNFRYVFYTIMFIMYCAFSSILINFPLEFPIVSREHFNRWYSLRAYYVAITLADIPIQLICTNLFVLITYYLTAQPMELIRIVLFSLIIFLTALVGQSIGLAVGASLSVQLGAILGPFFICPFLTFSGFFLQEKDAPSWLKWLFTSSFLKYSLDGAMLSIFGFDRPKLDCNEIYCHYARPKIFLKDLDMQEANYLVSVIFLLSLFIGLRILAFYIMSFRLRLFR